MGILNFTKKASASTQATPANIAKYFAKPGTNCPIPLHAKPCSMPRTHMHVPHLLPDLFSNQAKGRCSNDAPRSSARAALSSRGVASAYFLSGPPAAPFQYMSVALQHDTTACVHWRTHIDGNQYPNRYPVQCLAAPGCHPSCMHVATHYIRPLVC